MNTREQQRKDRKIQILKCGLDMIVARGFEATKIRDIAKRLSISAGLFFNYFESKEALYVELAKIGVDGPLSVLQLNSGDIQPLVVFAKITEAIFQHLKGDGMTAKMFVLMTQAMISEATPDAVKAIISRMDMITPLVPIIEKGQQNGRIKKGDPQALLTAYWGAISGIAVSCAGGMRPLPESSWIVDILRA